MEIIYNQIVLGKEFKIYGTNEKPLFLAKDVAEWIDYSVSNVSKMLKSVDDDEKTTRKISTNGLYQTDAWFLTEDGLYEVLMQSRKPIAKQFKKEVKQILKQLRLTGGVVVEDREEEFINNYFPSFSEEVKLAMVQDLKKQNKKLKDEIDELKPQAENWKKYMDSDGYITVTELARVVNLKRIDIFNLLREKEFVCQQKALPTKKGVERKLLVQLLTTNGYPTMKLTTKGVDFLIEQFRR